MTEKQIQKIITQQYIIPRSPILYIDNIYLYKWESDKLCIDSNYMVTEFEVKCSKWDYLNDFKKIDKHKLLIRLDDLYELPNYFFYICPEDMIEIDSLPEYAGLIYIIKSKSNKYYPKVIKRAPILHKEKFNRWEEIAVKLFYKNI